MERNNSFRAIFDTIGTEQGQQVLVPLWRNSATAIAERRFMFELLTFMKRAHVSSSPEVSQCIEKCAQHYVKVLEVEEGRQKSLLENIQVMTDRSTAEVDRLRIKIQNLFMQQTEEVGAQKEVSKPGGVHSVMAEH
eukprot:1519085-Rhodomonas_salina.1